MAASRRRDRGAHPARTVQHRVARRRFLILTGSLAAACTASQAASASSLVWSLRDRWLYRRLSRSMPSAERGVMVWPGDGRETLVGWRETGPVLALNETAAFLLASCRGRKSVAEMAEDLHRIFGARMDEARRDAALTIRELSRLGLVDPIE